MGFGAEGLGSRVQGLTRVRVEGVESLPFCLDPRGLGLRLPLRDRYWHLAIHRDILGDVVWGLGSK